MNNRKKHYAIELDFDEDDDGNAGTAWIGACWYAGWYRTNIDYKLKYLWDNNTMDKDEVTCKRCLAMLKNDLGSHDYL